MTEQRRTTVTLCWRADDGVHTKQMACADQLPHQLIPKLVRKIGLPTVDQANDPLLYKLRLDGEGGTALKQRELLSTQHVYDGSRLWLVAELAHGDDLDKRCLLQLPDGTEIVIPPRGQQFWRKWLLKYVELSNPDAYWQELERLEGGQSAYTFVSNTPHCAVSASETGSWVITTDRSDILTEWATDRDFDRVRPTIPQQLFNGTRLRLGGSDGLELTIVLI